MRGAPANSSEIFDQRFVWVLDEDGSHVFRTTSGQWNSMQLAKTKTYLSLSCIHNESLRFESSLKIIHTNKSCGLLKLQSAVVFVYGQVIK